MAKYNVEAIESTFGFYYRQFDDYQPWLAPQVKANLGEYRVVYPVESSLPVSVLLVCSIR